MERNPSLGPFFDCRRNWLKFRNESLERTRLRYIIGEGDKGELPPWEERGSSSIQSKNRECPTFNVRRPLGIKKRPHRKEIDGTLFQKGGVKKQSASKKNPDQARLCTREKGGPGEIGEEASTQKLRRNPISGRATKKGRNLGNLRKGLLLWRGGGRIIKVILNQEKMVQGVRKMKHYISQMLSYQERRDSQERDKDLSKRLLSPPKSKERANKKKSKQSLYFQTLSQEEWEKVLSVNPIPSGTCAC